MDKNKKWQEDKYENIKKNSSFNEAINLVAKCYNFIYKTNFPLKLMSLSFRWISISLIVVFFVIILSSYYFSIYTAFKSDKERFYLNNSTYYELFTEYNFGISYDTDKNKLKYLSIIGSIFITLQMSVFVVPLIYYKLNSIIFLIISFFVNTSMVVLNWYSMVVCFRLSSSISKYLYHLYFTFTEKGIPLDDIPTISFGGSEFLLGFCFSMAYYNFIFNMFRSKREYEKENPQNDVEPRLDIKEGLNYDEDNKEE